MEYKVGYIKIKYDDGDYSDWTVGLMHENILQFYNISQDAIVTRNGTNVHESFALSQSGCSVFTERAKAIECFKTTIKVIKKEKEEKDEKEAKEFKDGCKWWGWRIFWVWFLLTVFGLLIRILEMNGIISQL